MLRITKKQRAAFHTEQGRQFERRMYTHLRGGCSPAIEGGMSDEALMTLIRSGVQDAAVHGIVRQYDVRRFLEHLTTHGYSFKEAAPVAGVLQDQELCGTVKMDLIDAFEQFRETP